MDQNADSGVQDFILHGNYPPGDILQAISRSCSSTKGRASSSKVVLRPIFHEEANGPIPEALRASFVNFQAN